MANRIEILDHGFVELVDFMGSDYAILRSARVSTGGVEKKGDKEDRGLIRYLMRKWHSSPTEQTAFTFHFKVPMLVLNQMVRHRTFSFNIFSKRYSEAIHEYYTPEVMRKQGEKNHQGSGEDLVGEDNANAIRNYDMACKTALIAYDHMIEAGVSRELARGVLPESIYSEGYFTVDLRNLFHFLQLRLHPHAQYEIQVFAKAVFDILKSLDAFKWSVEAFEDYVLNSTAVYGPEKNIIAQLVEDNWDRFQSLTDKEKEDLRSRFFG